jgi:hypothetical protein
MSARSGVDWKGLSQSMTPEQAYDEIVAHLKSFHLPSMHVDALAGLLITEVVTPAIRAAVKEERAACALVAESCIPSGFTGTGKAGNTYAIARDDRARTIATAIRARGGHANG